MFRVMLLKKYQLFIYLYHINRLVFRRLHNIIKSDYQLCHFCPSVRMKQLCSHWTDFLEIWYLNIFPKPAEKTQISLKSGKNTGYFT